MAFAAGFAAELHRIPHGFFFIAAADAEIRIETRSPKIARKPTLVGGNKKDCVELLF